MKKDSSKNWPGVITISDPVRFINEIALRYETLERVVMEYIDNSIDDADDMAKLNGDRYPYPIRVNLSVDRKRKQIIITDNCRGMDFRTLSRVVNNIAESNKRTCSWLNGQFGFGVHAFRACCKEIIFETKHKDDKYYKLIVTDDNINVKPPIIFQVREFPTNTRTGTIITLHKFKEDLFDILSAEAIKEEIETHFESMLKKENIVIEISYKDELPMKCEAFDYGQVPGKIFHKEEYILYKKNQYPIEIFLKVTEIPMHRRPRFFAKGRRIMFVKDDNSFRRKSHHKLSVWDHTNLTGYIDVGDLVEPVITRDGFKRGKNRTLLYDTVLKFENEIKKIIDEINKKYEDHSLNKLEDVLSKALRKLAREDALRFRTEVVKGNGDVTLEASDGGTGPNEGRGPTGPGEGPTGPGEGPTGPGEGPTGPGEGPKPQEGTSTHQGTRRRASGFSIKFSHLPPDIEGKVLRSQFNDGLITINMDHLDFADRIGRTRQGDFKITRRLISYIAAVISIHYKDQYYGKYHNQPEARTELFDQQVEFIFRLESTLLPFLKEIEDMILFPNGNENG